MVFACNAVNDKFISKRLLSKSIKEGKGEEIRSSKATKRYKEMKGFSAYEVM